MYDRALYLHRLRHLPKSIKTTHRQIQQPFYHYPFQWTQDAGGVLHVAFPDLTKVTSRWAWVLKMDDASPAGTDEKNAL